MRRHKEGMKTNKETKRKKITNQIKHTHFMWLVLSLSGPLWYSSRNFFLMEICVTWIVNSFFFFFLSKTRNQQIDSKWVFVMKERIWQKNENKRNKNRRRRSKYAWNGDINTVIFLVLNWRNTRQNIKIVWFHILSFSVLDLESEAAWYQNLNMEMFVHTLYIWDAYG